MISEKSTYLLNVKNRILKLILLPIFSLTGLTFFLFLTGRNGRLRRFQVPAVIQLDLTLLQVFGVIIIFLALIYITIKLILLDDHIHSLTIRFKGDTILIDEKRFVMTFKLKKADRIEFLTSKFLAKLYFDIYYRVGIIKIKYNGDKYKFFFPIENYGHEEEILKMIENYIK